MSCLICSQESVDHTDPIVLDQHYYLYIVLGTVVVFTKSHDINRDFCFKSLSVYCVEETTYQHTCLQNATMKTFYATNKKNAGNTICNDDDALSS